MSIEGWYYLHTNGDLIYKRDYDSAAADIRESPFARGLWAVDPTDRAGAWGIVVEALAAGADKKRIAELAEKWGLTDADGEIYAEHIGVNLFPDGNQLCATRRDFRNLQESPAGFGSTAIEAFADLAKHLGYQPSKMWGATFTDLVRQ